MGLAVHVPVPAPTYTSSLNQSARVVDFVKSGGTKKNELRIFWWAVSLYAEDHLSAATVEGLLTALLCLEAAIVKFQGAAVLGDGANHVFRCAVRNVGFNFQS